MKQKSKNTTWWLWKVVGKKKWYILLLTLLQALTGMVGVLYALVFKRIVDSAVAKDAEAFKKSVIFTACIVIIQLALNAGNRWFNELAKADTENALKKRLTDNILGKDYSQVSKVHTAEWINRLTNDTTVVANGIIEIIPGLSGTIVRMVSAIIMILTLDPRLAYILLPSGIMVVVITYGVRGILKKLHKNIQEKDGKLRVYLQERISSLMIIKAFTAEEKMGQGAVKLMEEHKGARLKRNIFSNVANTGFGAMMQGMYFVGVIYVSYNIMTDRLSYGTLVAIMQLIGQVQGPFASISGYLPRWYAMLASTERLMEIEKYENDEEALDSSELRELYEELEAIGLRNAGFEYEKDEKSLSVFKNLELEIKKGEYVAFTGHSGCGKSTVLKLLMSMYPLSEGTRYIKTKTTEDVITSRHRKLFAYVPQGNVLMNGTIGEVVCFAKEKDNDKIQKVLKIACADEFVEDIDKELGERGTGLSEGQMQRLAVARALYSDSPILLLDESTSALDDLTEKKLLENLRQLTEKTVIIVTHRKAALSICDRVLRFTENGVEEVEKGKEEQIEV